MDSFYWIVLTLASLVLIGALAFIGWTMGNQKKGTKYPTITTTCPDNWKAVKSSDGKVYCQRPDTNEYNRGDSSLDAYMADTSKNGTTTLKGNGSTAGSGNGFNMSLLDFDATAWGANGNPTCAKREWATKYKVKWDSVENANYC
jgi:hypothetical protein